MGRLAQRLSPAGEAIVAQGAEKRHAMQTLRERGIPAAQVIRVDPYAISFTSQDGEVLTAWMVYVEDRDRLIVWTQPGLPAFP